MGASQAWGSSFERGRRVWVGKEGRPSVWCPVPVGPSESWLPECGFRKRGPLQGMEGRGDADVGPPPWPGMSQCSRAGRGGNEGALGNPLGGGLPPRAPPRPRPPAAARTAVPAGGAPGSAGSGRGGGTPHLRPGSCLVPERCPYVLEFLVSSQL